MPNIIPNQFFRYADTEDLYNWAVISEEPSYTTIRALNDFLIKLKSTQNKTQTRSNWDGMLFFYPMFTGTPSGAFTNLVNIETATQFGTLTHIPYKHVKSDRTGYLDTNIQGTAVGSNGSFGFFVNDFNDEGFFEVLLGSTSPPSARGARIAFAQNQNPDLLDMRLSGESIYDTTGLDPNGKHIVFRQINNQITDGRKAWADGQDFFNLTDSPSDFAYNYTFFIFATNDENSPAGICDSELSYIWLSTDNEIDHVIVTEAFQTLDSKIGFSQ